MLILTIMLPGSNPITVKTKGPSKFSDYTEIWLHEALHKKYGFVMKININMGQEYSVSEIIQLLLESLKSIK